MCELAGLITAMSAVVGGVSSLSKSSQQAQSAHNAQEYQAAVQSNNAYIEQTKAQYAKDQGLKNIDDANKERASVLGKIKAARGASGVTMSGSPVDQLVSAETDYNSKIDSIRENTAREVWGYNANANTYINNANNILSQSTGVGFSPLFDFTQSVMGVSNKLLGSL